VSEAQSSISRRVSDEIERRWRAWHVDEHTLKFIRHNQRIWQPPKPNGIMPEVLVNFDALCINHIRISYITNALVRQHGAVIKSYSGASVHNKRRIRLVYESFGVRGHVITQLDGPQRRLQQSEFDTIRPGLNTRQDILNLSVLGVPVGDDIYDTYLREGQRGTVDFDDPVFDQVLLRSIGLVIFWQDYFARNRVAAAAVSLDAYIDIMALVKVAYAHGVPVTNVDLVTPAKRGASTTAHAYFAHLHDWFLQLPLVEQETGLATAAHYLDRRLRGEVGVGISYYMNKSPFHGRRSGRVLRESKNPKVLICTHEFSDAPHCYGEMLFLDFYEWMDYLGKMSLVTDYDWYVKYHPGYWDVSVRIVNDFLKKYPRLSVIPPYASHLQLVEEGLDCVFTCMGSVAHEYPALGVPVINAAYNPHAAYTFSYTPKTVDEFRQLMLTVPRQKPEISQREIHEFFYMFNYDLLSDQVGVSWWRAMQQEAPFGEVAEPRFYTRFLRYHSEQRHQEVLDHLSWALPAQATHPAQLALLRYRQAREAVASTTARAHV